MVRASIIQRLVALSACGLVALAVVGCGGDTPSPEVIEQSKGENQAAARAAAYGNANNPGARGRAAARPRSTGSQSRPN